MKRSAALLVSLVAAVACASASSAVLPQATPQFADRTPVTVTWKKLQGSGKKIAICNPGNETASGRLLFAGFNFLAEERDISDSAVLEVLPLPVEVRADRCRDFFVHARFGASIDSGSYKGVVLLRRAGGLERLPMTVDLAVETPTPLQPASADQTVELTREGAPWKASTDETGEELLLLEPSGDVPTSPKKGDLLGVLANDDDPAFVYAADAASASTEPGAYELPLKIVGADDVGTYSGTLNLSTAEKPVPVKLIVKVTDSAWWAIAAVLAGIALAVIPLLITRRWVVELNRFGRRHSLPTRYSDAQKSFDEHYGQASSGTDRPPYANYLVPEKSSVKTATRTFRKSFRTYARTTVLFDTASDRFKKADEPLVAAEADAKFFGDQDGFGKAVKDLHDEIRHLADFGAAHRDADADVPPPSFVNEAVKLIVGRRLTVGEATKIGDQAKALTDLVKEWLAQAERVARFATWGAAIEAHGGLDPTQQRQLSLAKAELREAANELLDVKTKEDLQGLKIEADLDRTYERLASLGSTVGVWPSSPRELRTATLGYRGESPFANWLQGVQAAGIAGDAIKAVVVRGGGLFYDLAAVAIALGTSVALALTTLYDDDVFGTWKDYLAALGFAGAATVAAKAIIDALSTSRNAETSSEATKAPAAASTPAPPPA